MLYVTLTITNVDTDKITERRASVKSTTFVFATLRFSQGWFGCQCGGYGAECVIKR